MEYIGPAMQVAGTIGSTIAGRQATSANQDNAKVEAQQAVINAGIEENKSRRNAERVLAKQRAMGAAAGVDTSSGTTLEVLLDSARQAEDEALTIRAGGQMKANAAKYKGYLAGQKGNAELLGGLASLGGIVANNKSILGDLWTKAKSAYGGGSSSGWAASVPPGKYSIS